MGKFLGLGLDLDQSALLCRNSFSCRHGPNMVSRHAETTGFCPTLGHGRKGGMKAAL
jgi:hypothetical protein